MDPSAIVVAIIGLIGTVLAALIQAAPTVRKLAGIYRIGLVVVGLAIGITIGLLVADRVVPCTYARIAFPAGSRSQAEAVTYEVPSEVTISWKPAACPMTVQYYQKNSLLGEYRNVVSGTRLTIGAPGSGETQIKIWNEGRPAETPCDSRWVWVR